MHTGALEKESERVEELKGKFEGLDPKVCNIKEKYGSCPSGLWKQLAKAEQDGQLAYAIYKEALREGDR